MEEEPIKSDLNNAVCEMNLLYANRHTFASASPPEETGSSSRFRCRLSHNTNLRPIFTLTTTKVQMNLNPRYISKVATTISNSPRKMYDTSLRMRPYFIPERSRTKSENAVEPSSTLPNHSASLYSDIHAETLCSGSEQVANVGPSAATSAMDTSCDGAFEMIGNTGIIASTVSGVLAKTGGKINDKPCSLKKSKSLEDIYSAGRGRNADGSQPSHEMEFVSSRIQKLKVQD